LDNGSRSARWRAFDWFAGCGRRDGPTVAVGRLSRGVTLFGTRSRALR